MGMTKTENSPKLGTYNDLSNPANRPGATPTPTVNHRAPLAPGEIRTHTVGVQRFQVMYVAGGSFAQASVRNGDGPTKVIRTDRFADVVVRAYADAIEQAESDAADALDDADGPSFTPSGAYVATDRNDVHAEARVENLLRQRWTAYPYMSDESFDEMVRRMQSSFGLPVTGVPRPEADLSYNLPMGADMGLVTGEAPVESLSTLLGAYDVNVLRGLLDGTRLDEDVRAAGLGALKVIEQARDDLATLLPIGRMYLDALDADPEHEMLTLPEAIGVTAVREAVERGER